MPYNYIQNRNMFNNTGGQPSLQNLPGATPNQNAFQNANPSANLARAQIGGTGAAPNQNAYQNANPNARFQQQVPQISTNPQYQADLMAGRNFDRGNMYPYSAYPQQREAMTRDQYIRRSMMPPNRSMMPQGTGKPWERNPLRGLAGLGITPWQPTRQQWQDERRRALQQRASMNRMGRGIHQPPVRQPLYGNDWMKSPEFGALTDAYRDAQRSLSNYR